MTDTPSELARDFARLWVAVSPAARDLRGMDRETIEAAIVAGHKEMDETCLEVLASLLRATGPWVTGSTRFAARQ
jgi:hypothetical protein